MKQGLDRFVRETIAPLNYAVGDAWVRGEPAVFEEHFYTEQVEAVLRSAVAAIQPRGRPPRMLLTTFPHAAAAGVGERVSFEHAGADAYRRGKFDLICFFDCLHDMGHPDAAARHARGALAEGGTVMLVEPYAEDQVENNLNTVGRLYYSASTTLCCAHAIAEGGNHVLGAQAGSARLEKIFREAGFSAFRVAAQTPFNLILEARA